jgi:hypothetical protein
VRWIADRDFQKRRFENKEREYEELQAKYIATLEELTRLRKDVLVDLG